MTKMQFLVVAMLPSLALLAVATWLFVKILRRQREEQPAPWGRMTPLAPSVQGRMGVAVFWGSLLVALVAEVAFHYELSTTGPLSWIEPVVLIMAIGLWLDADIRARNAQNEHSGALAVGIVFIAPIVVPIYLVKTRGAKGTLVWLLRFAACFLLVAVVATLIAFTKQKLT